MTGENKWRVQGLGYDAAGTFQNSSNSETTDGNDFYCRIWEKFDLNYALDRLLNEKESYSDEKEIIFYAFCAWMVAPFSTQMRQDAISQCVGSILVAQEEKSSSIGLAPRHIAHIISHLSDLDERFYENIYLPIGGIGAILDASSPARTKIELRIINKYVKSMVMAARIMHFSALHLVDRKTYGTTGKTNISKAIARIAKRGPQQRGLGEQTIESTWDKHKDSLLIVYAANHVMTSRRPAWKENTFLETILSGKIRYAMDIEHIPEIVGRVAYLKEIMIKMASDHLYGDLLKLNIPNISSIKTDLYGLNEDDIKDIKEEFRKTRRVI